MSTVTARPRRSFSPEFKARTVELVRDSGKSVAEVCRELDLTETAVRRCAGWPRPTSMRAAAMA